MLCGLGGKGESSNRRDAKNVETRTTFAVALGLKSSIGNCVWKSGAEGFYGVNELAIAHAAIGLLLLTIEVGYRVGGRLESGFGYPC